MSEATEPVDPEPVNSASKKPIPASNGVWLVAQREIWSKLRSKAFLFSTGFLLVGVLASVLLGGILGGQPSSTKVAVLGGNVEVLGQFKGLEPVAAQNAASAESMVRSGEVEAAIVPDSTSPLLGFKVVALNQPPTALLQSLSIAPNLQLLEPGTQDPLMSYFVAIGFGLIFFVSSMIFGQTIAQSVVEEKQTRIVEILLSTVSARTLLTGKILGNSILAFAQIGLIAALSAGGLLVTGQRGLSASLGPSIGWFLVFFVIGFVMIAALYAGSAALVSRQEDVGSATAPVMTLVMLPYVLVIVFFNNPTVLTVMSYVPFSAAVGMPMRLFAGTAQWWEPLLALLILLVTTALMVLLGARIYRNSLLRTGAKVPLREALKG